MSPEPENVRVAPYDREGRSGWWVLWECGDHEWVRGKFMYRWAAQRWATRFARQVSANRPAV